MRKICKDGRIWGQNNKEAGGHLGLKTGKRKYIKKGYNTNSAENIKVKFKKGHLPTKGCFKKGQFSGKNNPHWKGGITSLVDLIRKLPEYKQWRYEVFKQDGFICRHCGKNRILEAHHKKAFAKLMQEFLRVYNQFSPIDDKETLVRLALAYQPFWDLANGLTLCVDCHQKIKEVT
ncbi:hypothetical protein D4R71_00355 [bacterium]|nr:MAG: hypothetical protein D4R71_00355 [bacterium]